ncbi:MAG: type II secretion system protein GspL [Gammaproteobacteria bacterium]|jgi:general secretion pathway protein L
MNKYFLVYPLNEDWQQVAWCGVAEDEALQVKRGSLETLHQIAAQVPMIAVIPGTWLNMFSIDLPKGRANQVKKALPFLLEEQIAEDLENVHIALPIDFKLGTKTPVAVISKARMQTLINAFKNQQLNLQQAIPDWLCLPQFPQTWTLHLGEAFASVRQKNDLGFSVQKDLLMPMLNLALKQALEKPQSLHVYHLPLEAADMEEQLTTLDIPLAYEAISDEPLLLWAEHFAPPAAINLLQGEFYVKPRMAEINRIWRKAGMVAAAIVAVQLIYSSIEYQHLKKQYDSVHAQVTSLYQTVFPGQAPGNNARAQLESLLAKNKGGGDNPLFNYLQAVSEPLLNTQDVDLQQISLHEKNLKLEVIVKDFGVLGELENAISAKGLSVKQDSASLEKDHVIAQLQVTQGK